MKAAIELRVRSISAYLLVGMVAVLLMLTQSVRSGDDGDDGNGGIIAPRDAVEATGMSYGEWAGEWWNWALQFPTATNPVVEEIRHRYTIHIELQDADEIDAGVRVRSDGLHVRPKLGRRRHDSLSAR